MPVVPNLVGLVMRGSFENALACLVQGGTPEDCSQKFGVRLELTEFFAQTDKIAHGPVKLLFQDNTGADAEPAAIHGDVVVFGQDPVPNAPVGPNIILKITVMPPPPLGRFPRRGDRGLEVLELQQALTDRGFPVTTDGVFFDETEAAVVAFAHKENIPVPMFIAPPLRRIWTALGLPIDQSGVPGLLDTR
jgi:hypothetical protein